MNPIIRCLISCFCGDIETVKIMIASKKIIWRISPKWSWFRRVLKVIHTASAICRSKAKNPPKVKCDSWKLLLKWIGLESNFVIKKIRKAQPKKGAETMMKSNTNRILGLSYLIPVLPGENKFNSLIVVPVIRHINA